MIKKVLSANITNVPNIEISEKPIRKWAYAFLVGGALNPTTQYLGFIYGVVVAAKSLQEKGSQADVVLMVQISYNTNATRLPADEEALLQSVGVRIVYIPKFVAAVHEQFYALVMEKFRVLEMTEYSRVLFLDSDIMPLCNLDYIFELSEPQDTNANPFLKENVVLSLNGEAGHAGFFMLTPGSGKFEQLQNIIRRREEEALTMEPPYWDPVVGWGQPFNATNDFWRSPKQEKGLLWDWWSAFADQGLIYYWAKYHEKSTSIIIHSEVEQWGKDKAGNLQLEHTSTGSELTNFTCVTGSHMAVEKYPPPYRDYIHFTGRSKPWDHKYSHLDDWLAGRVNSQNASKPATISKRQQSQVANPTAKQLLWFSTLQSVARSNNYTVSASAFMAKTAVGRFSQSDAMYEHIVAKQKRGWTAYH